MKFSIIAAARLAVLTLVVAPLAGLAFAQGAAATTPTCGTPTPTAQVDTATGGRHGHGCVTEMPPTSKSPTPPASVSASASASPSASASTSPRVTESASGTAHRSPTPSASPAAASLPVTGTSGTIALVGLAAVLVGGAAILVSRLRRKVKFVAE